MSAISGVINGRYISHSMRRTEQRRRPKPPGAFDPGMRGCPPPLRPQPPRVTYRMAAAASSTSRLTSAPEREPALRYQSPARISWVRRLLHAIAFRAPGSLRRASASAAEVLSGPSLLVDRFPTRSITTPAWSSSGGRASDGYRSTPPGALQRLIYVLTCAQLRPLAAKKALRLRDSSSPLVSAC